MYPPRRQQPELHPLRIGRPQVGDDAGIICWLGEQFICEARVGEVIDEDERQRKTHRNAQELRRRQTKGAPFVDRPQREHKMDAGSTIEQYRARQAVPDLFRVAETLFSRIERNEAKRVIDEMRGDVSEENETGRHSQVAAQHLWRQTRKHLLAPRQPETDRIRQRHRRWGGMRSIPPTQPGFPVRRGGREPDSRVDRGRRARVGG